jgi:PmbA protein
MKSPDSIDDRPRSKPGGAAALSLLHPLIDRAVAAGASAADAVFVHRRALTIAWRLGKQESLERADAADIGLRVLSGRRQALVSTSDFSETSLRQLVERAMGMVREVPEDPFCGLAEPGEVIAHPALVDGDDGSEPSVAQVSERAADAEAAALAVAGVTNSEGAEAWSGHQTYAIVASNGLEQTYRRSWHGVSVSVLAGSGTAMERDYDYASAVYADDLPAPAAIGRNAAERAVRRLGARKMATRQVPVVFEPRVARSLLSHLAAAVNGAAVARGTTFLKDRLGERVFGQDVTIVDDPLRRRGLRSRPFDGEGIPATALKIIDQGVLTTWLLDLRSARQLGVPTTGRADRGPSSLPSPSATNLFLEPGRKTAAELVGEIAEGFYVTEMIGFGVNGVTGDYSRGASGFWIEQGTLAYPVSEMTVSGNLLAMFARITAASDLDFRYGIDAPTVRIDGMTVAGR